ncbi:MAG TPA: lysophospholipid acyltransferase family protein, partial [Solirubrobacterales bacterium]
MDEMKPQVYKDPRPAEYFDEFHQAARKRAGWTYWLGRVVLTLPTILLYRVRAIGIKNVPKRGPLVLAPNHFSQMDHFFAGVYLRRRIRFMAKSQLFSNPVIKFIFWHGGPFPIRRGHQDEEAFRTAYEILNRGGCL